MTKAGDAPLPMGDFIRHWLDALEGDIVLPVEAAKLAAVAEEKFPEQLKDWPAMTTGERSNGTAHDLGSAHRDQTRDQATRVGDRSL